MQIDINNRTKTRINEESIKKLVSDFFKYFQVNKTQVSIVIVGDKKMRNLNKTYRRIDKTTDVLAFEESIKTGPFRDDDFLGEIIVNYRQIKRQAKNFSKTINQELLFIITHGLLHLLGYKDDTARKKEAMITLADEFLNKK